MLISVVIPAHNAAHYLEETLQSVLHQTLQPDEVLIIDDASTDETSSIAARFAPLVRIIHTVQGKPSATRNIGVQQASGEWIAFLDADDIWEPNKLERQMQELANNPDADICYTGRSLLVQQGDTYKLDGVIPVPPADKIREALFRGTTFQANSLIIRRSVYTEAGGQDTNLTYAEDWDMWLRLSHAGKQFVACPEPLVQYRVHPASLSQNAIPSFTAAMAVYKRHVHPYIPGHRRWISWRKVLSQFECDTAFILRDHRDSDCLPMMARSVLHYPFKDSHRYKVLLYMLYQKLRTGHPVLLSDH